MEKEELMKKYIDEIKTYKFYELIPYLANGEEIIAKDSINVANKRYRSYYVRKGQYFDDLMTCECNLPHPIPISWEQLTSDGYIRKSDLILAVEKCDKAFAGMNKENDKHVITDDELEKNRKLFLMLAEIMSMDLVVVTGNKTTFSELAKRIKEIDEILSKDKKEV